MLTELTKNKFVSKDTIEFARNTREQNPGLFMAFYGIDSLFINVPLDETIEISVNNFFVGRKNTKDFEKNKLTNYFAFKDSFYLFNGTYYEQKDEKIRDEKVEHGTGCCMSGQTGGVIVSKT